MQCSAQAFIREPEADYPEQIACLLVDANIRKVTMQTRSKTKQSKSSRENDAIESCGRVPIKMDQGLWSKLPAELLEQALPFLPVPYLYRFRIVCKRWNNLISSPEFGKVCMLNASKRANERGCLVVKLQVDFSITNSSRRLPGWSILDLNEKRWYNLKHEVPKGYDDVLAMDGGLVCTFVDAFTEEQRRAPNCISHPDTEEDQTLVMFNLFGGVSKVLPNPPPLGDSDFWDLKLILENTSNTFKIFLMNMLYGVDPIDPCFCVYESSTGQWRNLPNPPGAFSPHWQQTEIPRNAIFQGLFYLLYESVSKALKLCRFNFLENSWEDTDVQFLQSNVKSYDLVVSDNRLFLTTQHSPSEGTLEHRRERRSMEINEILLADKECRMVVRMEQSEVNRNFLREGLEAFGLNKSILLRGNGEGMMRYDLATGQWELAPENSSPERPESEDVGQTITQMNYLRLPNAPWIEMAEKELDTTKRAREELENLGLTLLNSEDLFTYWVLNTCWERSLPDWKFSGAEAGKFGINDEEGKVYATFDPLFP